MERTDYSKLNLKIGLEIHQQLDTHKLFCSCSSKISEEKGDYEIRREIRASAGETGKTDIAAETEEKKKKYFLYEGYDESTCLVELDEEPPRDLNRDALNTALQVALLLKAKIVDEIHIMRKTVADGSNTAGFQRTALIGLNGEIQTNEGKIKIETICIEEDSAKDIEKKDDYRILGLDRLGIPLVEIATDASIKTPEQAKEAAAYLGMILRSTGKAKRGLGTIRQDLNVSIIGGNRVEIKGAQDLRMIPKWIENEILRQYNLMEIQKELTKRVSKKDVEKELIVTNITNELKESESKVISTCLKNNGVIKAIKLKGFSSLIGYKILPERRLGTEFSDYGKNAAGVGGLFHSDELPKYGISEEEVKAIRKKLKCEKDDGFLLIADTEPKVDAALKSVMERVLLTFDGVVKEVRKANQDGSSSYLRPMPGGERMYPETDVSPIRPNIKDIKLPELISDKSSRLSELGLGKDLADLISKSGEVEMFEEFVSLFPNIKVSFIAETMIPSLKEIKRKYNLDTNLITKEVFEEVFGALNERRISKDSVIDILIEASRGKSVGEMIKQYSLLSDMELEKEIKNIVSENSRLAINALIGKAMVKLKGKADGKKIVEMLGKMKNG